MYFISYLVLFMQQRPLYAHDCVGNDDTTARQGYYIHANSAEPAWEKMAIRFSEEVNEGFTVRE